MADFAVLKERVSIEQAAEMLGLKLRQTGTQLRGACPTCNQGGERALVLTPAKQLFYCFAAGIGGDLITLVGHIKKCSLAEAGRHISDHFGEGNSGTRAPVHSSTSSPTTPPSPTKGFDPTAYAARLDAEHEALAPLGISKDTLRVFKAGYSTTGVNRGKLALPLHDRQGNCIGYFGRALDNGHLTFPNGVNPHELIFNGHQVKTGELYLVRDPLAVLKAFEAGVENVVAFLSPITPQQLEMLAALCDERKVETVELF